MRQIVDYHAKDGTRVSDDPICNERGIPESECPPHCCHANRGGDA